MKTLTIKYSKFLVPLPLCGPKKCVKAPNFNISRPFAAMWVKESRTGMKGLFVAENAIVEKLANKYFELIVEKKCLDIRTSGNGKTIHRPRRHLKSLFKHDSSRPLVFKCPI